MTTARPRAFDHTTLQSFRNLRIDGLPVPAGALKDVDLLLMPKAGVASFDFVSFWVRRGLLALSLASFGTQCLAPFPPPPPPMQKLSLQ